MKKLTLCTVNDALMHFTVTRMFSYTENFTFRTREEAEEFARVDPTDNDLANAAIMGLWDVPVLECEPGPMPVVEFFDIGPPVK